MALAALVVPARTEAGKPRSPTPTHSSTIALTGKDKLLLVVNQDTSSLSVIQVRGKHGSDTSTRLAEIPVGLEPRCVAVDARGKLAWVTNAISGTVSAVSLTGKTRFSVVAEIPVGTEPRVCALTPNGTRLFVANLTSGTVSAIDTAARSVAGTVAVGGHPFAVAITTNNNNKKDDDETVFVTEFFSELIPGKDQVADDGRQGVVHAFPSGALTPIKKITLSPLALSGFVADRGKFCNLTTSPAPANQFFCPDTSIADPANPTIMMDPQGAFPNQLASALIRGDQLFLPNVGAAPEPPVKFNVNVQALVDVIGVSAQQENAAQQVNLNAEVKAEAEPPMGVVTLDRLFGNDLAAIDADKAGTAFLIVSRGGNFVFKAALASGKITLGSPVVRFQTGNLPNGVAISQDGKRAYVNNEVNLSVTAIDLAGNTVLARDIASGTPPSPGTFAHAVLVGKLAFFTALGLPNDGLRAMPVRDIVPLEDRGKQSNDAWSSCSSCHPDGLTDNVTWSFADGPRQTLPLNSFFAKDSPLDQRIANWSAVRGSVTDFNNNSIAVQGGIGFADAAVKANIYNHGITQGASDPLDLQTLWVQTVRTLNEPQPGDVSAGRTVFGAQCASCHGGAKWTKSQVLYADDPAFSADPLATTPGTPRDPGVTSPGGGQIQTYSVTEFIGATPVTATIDFLDNVGTFDPMSPFEIRGAGGKIGQASLGGLGFNTPSLLGVAFNAPYLHDGSAETLDDVFAKHMLGGSTIAATLSAAEADSLKTFLDSIDGTTEPFPSDADAFRDLLAGGP